MILWDAHDSGLDNVLAVVNAAFGPGEVPELVRNLLNDSSARPLFSILAVKGGNLSDMLSTAARLSPGAPMELSILAPMR